MNYPTPWRPFFTTIVPRQLFELKHRALGPQGGPSRVFNLDTRTRQPSSNTCYPNPALDTEQSCFDLGLVFRTHPGKVAFFLKFFFSSEVQRYQLHAFRLALDWAVSFCSLDESQLRCRIKTWYRNFFLGSNWTSPVPGARCKKKKQFASIDSGPFFPFPSFFALSYLKRKPFSTFSQTNSALTNSAGLRGLPSHAFIN